MLGCCWRLEFKIPALGCARPVAQRSGEAATIELLASGGCKLRVPVFDRGVVFGLVSGESGGLSVWVVCGGSAMVFLGCWANVAAALVKVCVWRQRLWWFRGWGFRGTIVVSYSPASLGCLAIGWGVVLVEGVRQC
ncbi:hypothetical protein Droror1_Dr00008726 [Drosera rotundifolia]